MISACASQILNIIHTKGNTIATVSDLLGAKVIFVWPLNVSFIRRPYKFYFMEYYVRTNIISWGQVIQTPSQYSNDCGFLEQSVDVVLHRRTVYSLIPQKSFVSWLTPWRKDKETEYFYWLCFWIYTNKIPAVKLIQLTLQLWTLNSAIEQSTHYIVYTKSYNLRLWKCYLAFYHKIC